MVDLLARRRTFPYKIDSADLRLLLKEARLSGAFGIGWVDVKETLEPEGYVRRDEVYRRVEDIDKAVWQHPEIVILEDGWKRAHYKNIDGGSTWFNQMYPGIQR